MSKTEKIPKLTAGNNKLEQKPSTVNPSDTVNNNLTGGKNVSAASAVKSPQTGDESYILILAMMMIVSSGAIIKISYQKGK